jgi:excisionase family DNA binding protein
MDTNSPTLPPDVFEAIVTAFAETLVRHYRERIWRGVPETPKVQPLPAAERTTVSPWLTVLETAKHVQCGKRIIYDAVRTGSLRAVRIGAGKTVRIRVEWIDEWLQGKPTQKSIW